MAIRENYTADEQKAINHFLEQRESYMGWVGDEVTERCPYPVIYRKATKELMLQMAQAVDPKNPLWVDEKYASQTRWGSIIGVPFLPQRITHGGGGRITLKAPSDIYVDWWFPGTYWEFFAPIREGDSFRVWRSYPRLIDLTSLDGKGPRKFRIVSSDIKYINHKDEIVARFKRYFDETWYPMEHGQPPKLFKRYSDFTSAEDSNDEQDPPPDHVYTKEEMEYIKRIIDEEEIRGSKIRFWEDIQVGDELKPVILGPYTLRELAIDFASTAGPLHIPQAGMKGGDPKGFIGSPSCESFAGRLITNWMGNDGFIKKFRWLMMEHAHLGDTIIARGKVIKKYIEKNEHLADLSVWTECLGEEQAVHAVAATVSILSREDV